MLPHPPSPPPPTHLGCEAALDDGPAAHFRLPGREVVDEVQLLVALHDHLGQCADRLGLSVKECLQVGGEEEEEEGLQGGGIISGKERLQAKWDREKNAVSSSAQE